MHTCTELVRLNNTTGFVHFFRPKIQELFQDPNWNFEGLFFSKNLPHTKQRTCVRVTRAHWE